MPTHHTTAKERRLLQALRNGGHGSTVSARATSFPVSTLKLKSRSDLIESFHQILGSLASIEHKQSSALVRQGGFPVVVTRI